MTPLTVGWKALDIGAYAGTYQRSFEKIPIVAPTAKYFAPSTCLRQRYIEIYKRASANEQRLREETEGAFSSVRSGELDIELTRLIDDTMCLKRMRKLLHLDSRMLGTASFQSLERKTSSLQQKIRCMGIITELHFLRDEKDPIAVQSKLLGCLLRASAHIPCLRSKQTPHLIDISNKLVFENLLFVIRDRFIGLHIGSEKLEAHVGFIEDENLHLMNLDGLLSKLSVLIEFVKDPGFPIAVAEKIHQSSLFMLTARIRME